MATKRWAAIASLVGLLFAGCIDPVSDAGPAGRSALSATPVTAGSVLTNMTWASRHVGDLAVGLDLRAEEPTDCTYRWAAQGTADGLGPMVGSAILGASEPHQAMVGRGQGSQGAAIHVTSFDEIGLPRGPWVDGAEHAFTVTPADDVRLIFFARSLAPDAVDPRRGEPYFPANATDLSSTFNLSCADTVEITGIWSSDAVTLFDESTLRGGAGAHADVIFGTSGATATSQVSVDLSTQLGLLFLYLGGDILLNHLAFGVVDVETPKGDVRLVDHPTQTLAGCATGLACPHVDLVARAGPGSYRVSATYASVLHTGILEGAIVGLDPVSFLPE